MWLILMTKITKKNPDFLNLFEAFKDHGLSPGYFIEKYACKKDVERQKSQEKAALPQKKGRRLELKQERLTRKGAREAAEGDTYQSGTFISSSMFFHHFMLKCFLIIWILTVEVGMTPDVDTESIPEAVPKPGFTKVENLATLQVSYVVIDLETIALSKYIFLY